VRNLYKVLGIAKSADGQRIKSAFRSRAMRTHPDLNPGSRDAEERFRELLQAYEVLRDAHARALYDAHLAERRRDTWRRFAHSAAVMVTTFLNTTSSAIFVLGQQGISVHSETWQIATAWLTSVEVEPGATAGQSAVPESPPTTAAKAAAIERSRKQETEIAVSPKKAASKTASAAEPKAASAAPKSGAQASRPPAAEPMYSLGEWKLR
jgi:curved DNA-binding protein CbpA